MRIHGKILKLIEYAQKNRKLFLDFVSYRLKRMTPSWNNLHFDKTQTIKIGNVNFEIDFSKLGMSLYTKQMYFGMYELHIVNVMSKILKEGDTFIDVGANVGYLSAVAANLVGTTGTVVAFEPVPVIFDILKTVKNINKNYNIKTHNLAVGDIAGTVTIHCTTVSDIGGSSVCKHVLDLNNIRQIGQVDVESVRLDEFIVNNNLANIKLIKIDVEGYEYNVLNGLLSYLKSCEVKPYIICEVVPVALKEIGMTVSDLLQYMGGFGYQALNILDIKTPLLPNRINETSDVIFKPLAIQ